MKKLLKIKSRNNKGFTLIEVLIGLMVLTVAIVAATSLLISLFNTNKLIVKSLQAYYLAQEGIEAVRNIRDTNWMHNVDFKGVNEFYGKFEDGKKYEVYLNSNAWLNNAGNSSFSPSSIAELNGSLHWTLKETQSDDSIAPLKLCNGYFSGDCSDGSDTDFVRYVEISKPKNCENQENANSDFCENSFLVKSVVKYGIDRKIILEEVLTNWKKGAL